MYHPNQHQFMQQNMQIIPPMSQQQPHTPIHDYPNTPSQQIPLNQDETQVRDEAPLKLKKLDEINTLVMKSMHGIIQLFDEIAREKQQPLNKMKSTINEFIDNLKRIESELLQEINYLGLASTGHPHEGSIYGAKKDFDLAKQRLQLVTSQMSNLNNKLLN